MPEMHLISSEGDKVMSDVAFDYRCRHMKRQQNYFFSHFIESFVSIQGRRTLTGALCFYKALMALLHVWAAKQWH